MNAPLVWDREFLPLRGKLIECAAALDRLDAAGDDPRREKLVQALEVLCSQGDRVEKIQMIFSLPYDAHWQKGGVK